MTKVDFEEWRIYFINVVKSLLEIDHHDRPIARSSSHLVNQLLNDQDIILNASPLDEGSLTFMNQLSYDPLKPVGEHLGDDFNEQLRRLIGLKSPMLCGASFFGIWVICAQLTWHRSSLMKFHHLLYSVMGNPSDLGAFSALSSFIATCISLSKKGFSKCERFTCSPS